MYFVSFYYVQMTAWVTPDPVDFETAVITSFGVPTNSSVASTTVVGDPIQASKQCAVAAQVEISQLLSS